MLVPYIIRPLFGRNGLGSSDDRNKWHGHPITNGTFGWVHHSAIGKISIPNFNLDTSRPTVSGKSLGNKSNNAIKIISQTIQRYVGIFGMCRYLQVFGSGAVSLDRTVVGDNLNQQDLIVAFDPTAAYHFFDESNGPRRRPEPCHATAKHKSLILKHVLRRVFGFEGMKDIKFRQFQFVHAVMRRKNIIHVGQENVIPKFQLLQQVHPPMREQHQDTTTLFLAPSQCRILRWCGRYVTSFHAIIALLLCTYSGFVVGGVVDIGVKE